LKGVTSQLDYLHELGVTTLWLGPPWKGRAERDDYHGYAIQDFLNVDSRLGDRADLVELVAQAHAREMRVIFDVIVNHTGENWWYQSQLEQNGGNPPPFRPAVCGPYPFGCWLAGDGTPLPAGSPPSGPDDGVWPQGPLQSPDAYHRAGSGSYNDDDTLQRASAFAEFRWADWYNRDLALSGGPLKDGVLQTLIECWTYWLKLTDCDGFRIDTFKHFRVEEGRRFCAAIREYAESMGKDNFLLVAEVGGGDLLEEEYLTLEGRNLSAVLEVGEARQRLRAVAGGQAPPSAFFDCWPREEAPPPSATSEGPVPYGLGAVQPKTGSHRNLGNAFVYSLDDHDDLGLKYFWRFACEYPGRTIPAVALLVFTLGIPCLYYGAEQDLALPPDLRPPDRAPGNDRYIREAMFGPEHPRLAGREGHPGAGDSFDPSLPGFGPFGTAGHHVFDSTYPTFRKVSAMLAVRKRHLALRRGRQYLREIRNDGVGDFRFPDAGAMVAWSRILGTTEVLCIANLDPQRAHGADVTVDSTLNADGSAITLLLDTSQRQGETDVPAFQLATTTDGRRHVTIPSLGPAEVLILTNGSE
jgi:glycosidase